jgi:hypothetical protein
MFAGFLKNGKPYLAVSHPRSTLIITLPNKSLTPFAVTENSLLQYGAKDSSINML